MAIIANFFEQFIKLPT